jgi:hypothetical protein
MGVMGILVVSSMAYCTMIDELYRFVGSMTRPGLVGG